MNVLIFVFCFYCFVILFYCTDCLISVSDNVNEYLKLAANADKQQVQRIKSVFEKKNQKSAQTISQLQKKLDNYHKKVRELEMHGAAQIHRPPREVLRDMGQGLK